MGWNQSMLEMGDRIIKAEGVTAKNDKKIKSIFEIILESQSDLKALRIDTSLIQTKGTSLDLTG